MQLIWVFLVITIVADITRARNILDIHLEKGVIDSDLNAPKRPLYLITNDGTLGLFPSLPISRKKFIFNIKPLIETYSQTTSPEQYQKLSIKDINYYGNDNNAEITTRRSLTQTKQVTVSPHEVDTESVREKYSWKSKRKNIIYYPKVHKSEKNMAYGDNDSEKQDIQNGYTTAASQKPITTLLFPKSNNTKYFEETTVETVSEQVQMNNIVSDSKFSSDILNGNNSIVIEEKENITAPPNILIKSDSEGQMVEVIEPKENFFDLEKKDQDEFISVKGVNKMSAIESNFDVDDEMTTDSDIEYLVSRPKRSINVIEEENVAPTFSGIKITNQDYPISHDFAFKNIYT